MERNHGSSSRNELGQHTLKQNRQIDPVGISISPLAATAIRMVRNGHDDTGPNPGYQRNLLQKRLDQLRNGFSEIHQKAKHLIPQSVIQEMSEIEAVLSK